MVIWKGEREGEIIYYKSTILYRMRLEDVGSHEKDASLRPYCGLKVCACTQARAVHGCAFYMEFYSSLKTKFYHNDYKFASKHTMSLLALITNLMWGKVEHQTLTSFNWYQPFFVSAFDETNPTSFTSSSAASWWWPKRTARWTQDPATKNCTHYKGRGGGQENPW